MKLKKKADSPPKSLTISFRFSAEQDSKLREIALVLKKTMSEVIEDLINQGHKAVERDFPAEVKRVVGGVRSTRGSK